MTIVTLATIAKRAGVSEGTASRVLSGARSRVPISAATRARVEQAARELDYHPNAAARALSSGRARALAVVIREQARWRRGHPHHIFSAYTLGEGLSGLQEAAHQVGYRLVLDTVDEESLASPLDLWKSRAVDGLILWQLPAPEAFVMADCPCVSLGVEGPGAWIAADERGAGRIATEHLLALGHRRIGFVGTRAAQYYGACQRHAGYEEAMRAAGLPVTAVPVEEFLEEEGEAATRQLLEQRPELTALVAVNDLIAPGCLAAIRDLGLQVPQDISLAGIDDQRLASYLCPPLTTVRMPIYELGQATAHHLIATIEASTPTELPPLPPPLLIQRASSAPPRSHCRQH
ncbi:MAG: LacI family transcriptional regulator [Chloroflexi bacterium]|nr:LacI family transcriptional regulator [Chloroflexota bacterium]